jgi:hypothetical protein
MSGSPVNYPTSQLSCCSMWLWLCAPLAGLPGPRVDVLDAAVARAAAKRQKPKPEFAWGGTNPFTAHYK